MPDVVNLVMVLPVRDVVNLVMFFLLWEEILGQEEYNKTWFSSSITKLLIAGEQGKETLIRVKKLYPENL